jgi:hypothetical protein
MNIEYIDKTTVLIKKSLDWVPTRPNNKIVVSSSEVVSDFLNENKNLEIVSVSGPLKICNFRRESDASGEWVLKFKDKNVKKTNKQKHVQQKSKTPQKIITNTQKKKEE